MTKIDLICTFYGPDHLSLQMMNIEKLKSSKTLLKGEERNYLVKHFAKCNLFAFWRIQRPKK